MTTKKLAHKINGKFYYGWVIVLVAALAMFFSSPGQTYSISAFIDAYIEDFGFSRTLISSIYSLATLLSGALMILMGKMVDKFGEKWMLMISGLMLAITAVFNSFVFTIPMLAVGFFFSRYFGQGALTLIPGTLVPQWFKARRGFAVSILKLGVSIASVTVPLFNVYVIANYGWQATWRLWSIMLLVIYLPLMWFFIINTPEEIGLKPDNIELKPEEIEEEALEIAARSWHVNEAVKTRTFWLLGLIAMIGPLVTTGIVFHFYSILGERGLSPTEAAVALGLMGVPGFVFALISGYLIDHVGGRKILAAGLLTMAIGVSSLVFAGNIALAVLAILIYGSGQSMYFVSVGVMWPNFFGRKYLGSIQGVATFFTVVGSALGPFPFGLSFDLLGSYNPILLLVVGVMVVGSLMALRIHAPVKASL